MSDSICAATEDGASPLIFGLKSSCVSSSDVVLKLRAKDDAAYRNYDRKLHVIVNTQRFSKY